MNDADGNDKDASVFISSNDAQQVMYQLMKLGYLHQDNEEFNPRALRDGAADNDTFEAYQQWQQQQERTRCQHRDWDEDCQIIPTLQRDMYYNRQGLVKALLDELEKNHNGRATIQDLCHTLNIDYQTYFLLTFEAESTRNVKSNDQSKLTSTIWNYFPDTVTILKHGGNEIELISDQYWHQIQNEIVGRIVQHGRIKVLDLAGEYSLPLDTFIGHIVSPLTSENNNNIQFINESQCLVSNKSMSNMKKQVLEYFATVVEPVHIYEVCQQKDDWEVEQVIEWIQEELHKSDTNKCCCPGEIHVDTITKNHQTATFIPEAYTKQQEQEMITFLTLNGYITSNRISNRQALMKIVNEKYPDAFIIDNDSDDSVIILSSLLQELQIAIQDYVDSVTKSDIFDFQDYLPTGLINESIISRILAKIDFSDDRGVPVIAGNDRAILIRNDMIQQIQEQQVTPLILEFATSRAKELFHNMNNGGDDNADDDDNDDDENPTSNLKKGIKSKSKRARKSSKNKKIPHNEVKHVAFSIIPLSAVATAIASEYPFFHEENHEIPETIGWDDDEVDGEDENDTILVVAFCRKVICTDSFRKQCERAVNAELQQLQSEKDSKSRISRKDAAAKVRSVETAFEEVFVTLCYLIQAQAKFITFATNSEIFDEKAVDTLKEEFLQGPCADLTSRITQQCLFQEEQDSLFTFSQPGDSLQNGKGNEDKQNNSIGGLPPHCSTVDIASRIHPKSYLSCPPPREPLPILRESFSGNTGVTLSRQWILCGGECYRGGVRTNIKGVDDDGDTDDVEVHVRPGNMEGFISHLEENCLTLCGLPFKRLDKKSEKNFLFSRKQQLTSFLSTRTDPVAVLEYTIMILFQQVRQLVVSGSLLRGPTLSALCDERKLPPSVATALKTLNYSIGNDNGQTIDEKLVNLVKECGLCRDISKHDTTLVEEYLATA